MDWRHSTHLEFDFQSDNLGGAVIDSFWLTKDAPCGFGAGCPPPSGAPDLAGAAATGDKAKYRAMAEHRADRIAALRECWWLDPA